jgi:hypothetical protein
MTQWTFEFTHFILLDKYPDGILGVVDTRRAFGLPIFRLSPMRLKLYSVKPLISTFISIIKIGPVMLVPAIEKLLLKG